MQPEPGFTMLAARWRGAALALALLFSQPSVRADLWAYEDAWGVTHTAATQKDERYRLVYRDADAGRPERWNPIARLPPLVLAPPSNRASSPNLAPPTNLAPSPSLDPPTNLASPSNRAPPPKRVTGADDASGHKATVHEHLRAAASAYQVDYALLKAVVTVESGFNPNAVSPDGAVGLMQIKPSTARAYGVHATAGRLTDPRTNINVGARHLARLIKLFHGRLELAVAAYNAGENAVLRAGNKVPDYPQTRRYVRTVMGLYAQFKAAPPARS